MCHEVRGNFTTHFTLRHFEVFEALARWSGYETRADAN
jgi:hypothetical protein